MFEGHLEGKASSCQRHRIHTPPPPLLSSLFQQDKAHIAAFSNELFLGEVASSRPRGTYAGMVRPLWMNSKSVNVASTSTRLPQPPKQQQSNEKKSSGGGDGS